MQFVKSFLLTFTTFTNAAVLAQKLVQRYSVPTSAKVHATAVRLRVVNVAMMWARGLGTEYEPNPASVVALQRICAAVVYEGAARLAKAVQRAADRVSEREKQLKIAECQQQPIALVRGFDERLQSKTTVKIHKWKQDKHISYLMQLSAGHLAVQLTVVDERLFGAIRVCN